MIVADFRMNKNLPNSLRALFLSLAVLLSLPMLAEEIDGINYELNAEVMQATVIAKSLQTFKILLTLQNNKVG